MKILKLNFKNLNSLKGEWEIDFRKSEFSQSGIFAITEPTGSGKSTILDAITLALYGKTPRHKSINESQNEIMTKGTGECFAEVLFRVKDGKIYRSRWSQHRANRKANRTLQLPKVLLEELNAKTLATRLRDWKKKVEDICGLDFDRFIRSVLLAQGNFAIFLKAKEKEKSEILEKITGTDIYKKIGKKVHQKTKDIKDRVDRVKVKLDDNEILNDKGESLKNSLKEIENRLKLLEDYLFIDGEHLKRLKRLDELKELINKQEKDILDLKSNLEARKNDIFIVDTRNEALLLLREKNEINRKKIELKDSDKNISILNQNLLDKKNYLKSKINELESVNNLYIEFLTKFRLQNELIKDARLIDAKIENKENELKKIKKRMKTLGQSTEKKEFDSYSKDLKSLETQELKYSELLKDTLYLENLRDKDIDDAINIFNRLESIDSYLKDKDKQLSTKYREVDSLKKNKKKILKEIDFLSKKVNKLSGSLNYSEDVNIDSILSSLKIELDLWEIQRLQVELKTFENDLKDKEIEYSKLMDKKFAMDFNSLRTHLKEGEPCPLCGALKHPWKGVEFSVDDEKMEVLLKDIELLKKNITEINFQIELKKSSDKYLLNIKTDNNGIEEIKKREEFIKQRIVILEKEKLVVDEVSNISIDINERKKSLKIIDEKLDALNENLILLNRDIQAKKSEENEKSIYINKFIEQYKVDKDINSLKELKIAKEKFQKLKKQKDGLAKKIVEVEKKIEQLRGSISSKEKQLKTTREEEIEIRLEIKTLKDKRKNTFEEKELDSFEKSLEDEKNSFEKKLLKIKDNISKIESDIREIETKIFLVTKSSEKLSDAIITLEKDFQNDLANSKISNLELLLKLNIPQDSFEKIRSEIDSLRDSLKLMESRYKDSINELDSLKEKTGGYNIDELKRRVHSLEQEKESLNIKKGRIREQLSIDKENREKLNKILKELNDLKEEMAVWDRLDYMIGSSDGSKFSKFAQTLTMEYLLMLANEHLKDLSGRYIIAQKDILNQNDILSLIIIDKYQANTKRSVSTLSGGESFLVSLALALGLSDLAGDKIKIETLFLDEGFGTLDNEALESVLMALDTLRGRDKMVGVISHIDSIKERIPTQIEIKKDSSGIGYLSDRFKVNN